MSARLCAARLGEVAAQVTRPAYQRDATRLGVVHFGPGAFHRAHQAFYFDRMLAADPGLAISAVSLHSRAVREALAPQDGLYALVEREAEPAWRVIGSLREVLVAPDEPEKVLARLASPDLRVITATVTEKGYCLTPAGDLDLSHPDIAADLAGGRPRSFPGWLAAGLKLRFEAGLPAPLVISCDNLSDNGRRLRRAAIGFARAARCDHLADWIEREVRFPNSMVDSITPATDDALRAEAAQALRLADAWPIQRERFVQWVVEEAPAPLAQAFARAGVTVSKDVAAFERAKLRLLNGAHSTLAYAGLMLGHDSVAGAMADGELASFVERLMRQDIAASLTPTRDLDIAAYIGAVLQRFRNPAIVHRLSQIAWDGSQKLPFRLLATIGEALAAGRPVSRLAVGVAAWMAFVSRQSQADEAIVDPLAPRLIEIGRACTGEAPADVDAFLALGEVFPRALAQDPRLRETLTASYAALTGPQPRSVLSL